MTDTALTFTETPEGFVAYNPEGERVGIVERIAQGRIVSAQLDCFQPSLGLFTNADEAKHRLVAKAAGWTEAR